MISYHTVSYMWYYCGSAEAGIQSLPVVLFTPSPPPAPSATVSRIRVAASHRERNSKGRETSGNYYSHSYAQATLQVLSRWWAVELDRLAALRQGFGWLRLLGGCTTESGSTGSMRTCPASSGRLRTPMLRRYATEVHSACDFVRLAFFNENVAIRQVHFMCHGSDCRSPGRSLF